jgi:hypothetical protein
MLRPIRLYDTTQVSQAGPTAANNTCLITLPGQPRAMQKSGPETVVNSQKYCRVRGHLPIFFYFSLLKYVIKIYPNN